MTLLLIIFIVGFLVTFGMVMSTDSNVGVAIFCGTFWILIVPVATWYAIKKAIEDKINAAEKR